jgi:hypothetical protein
LIGDLAFGLFDLESLEFVFDGMGDEFIHAGIAEFFGGGLGTIVEAGVEVDFGHVRGGEGRSKGVKE